VQAAQGFCKGQRLRFFAVDYRDFFEISLDARDVAAQLILVGMARKRVQRCNLGSDLVRFAENITGFAPDKIWAPRCARRNSQ